MGGASKFGCTWAAVARSQVPQELEPDALLITELNYRLYRKGRWKLYVQRSSGKIVLNDLEGVEWERTADPETRSRIEPLLVARSEELARQLASARRPDSELTPEHRERLRGLGYLD